MYVYYFCLLLSAHTYLHAYACIHARTCVRLQICISDISVCVFRVVYLLFFLVHVCIFMFISMMLYIHMYLPCQGALVGLCAGGLGLLLANCRLAAHVLAKPFALHMSMSPVIGLPCLTRPIPGLLRVFPPSLRCIPAARRVGSYRYVCWTSLKRARPPPWVYTLNL